MALAPYSHYLLWSPFRLGVKVESTGLVCAAIWVPAWLCEDQCVPDYAICLKTFLLPAVCLSASFYWRQQRARRTGHVQNADGSPSLHRDQANPSVSPSMCSSPSFLSPLCKFSCIITSYHLSWNNTWSQNTRCAWKQAHSLQTCLCH